MTITRSNPTIGERFIGPLDQRESTWFWVALQKRNFQLEAEKFGNLFSRREHIGSQILAVNDPDSLKAELVNDMHYHLLESEELSWIRDDTRLLRWLQYRLSQASEYVSYLLPAKLSSRNRIIAQIDSADVNLHQKKLFISRLQPAWSKLLSDQSWNNWCQEDKLDKAWFTWRWLEKNLRVWGDNAPTSDKDVYTCVLSFFDCSNYSDFEKACYLEKVKRGWSQKKYQDKQKKRGKKQYNFNLEQETDEKIFRLSEELGLHRNQLIQLLVEGEFKERYYSSKNPSRPLPTTFKK